MPTFRELLGQLKETQSEIKCDEIAGETESGKSRVILDVRETDEVRQGHLPSAIHIPRGYLELKVEGMIPDRNTPIITYCAGGVRSLFAAETLTKMGYTNVRSMSGGFAAWKEKGLPIEKPIVLTAQDQTRYLRHLSMPEVGEKGQAKLLQSKVLLIGAGGLGCPAAYYLTAAGVGTLGIVDFDVVDESNLQRQILHSADRVGTSKIVSAKKTLNDFNPGVRIIPFEERLDSSNVDRIMKDFDVVLDGSDNFPTRYLINDACVKLKKPCIHGSVYRFEGQVSVFSPAHGGPCYRCLYPEPPPAEFAPSCAEAGVLGVLPGVIGLLEAIEVIKIILGIGDPLIGRLLAYDALSAKFREFKLRKDPNCNYCQEGKPFPGYIDYEFFCTTAERNGAKSS